MLCIPFHRPECIEGALGDKPTLRRRPRYSLGRSLFTLGLNVLTNSLCCEPQTVLHRHIRTQLKTPADPLAGYLFGRDFVRFRDY